MIYIGIDPGVSGAIATIEHGEVSFFDTPIVTIKSGKGMKNFMDPATAGLILQGLSSGREVIVAIEKVQAMPGGGERSMGATSAFNFGMNFGMWQGLCCGLLLPYVLVHPATWKKLLMRDMSKDKDASRVKAMQIYPKSAKDLNLKKHHGRADALLLAEYARKMNTIEVTLKKRDGYMTDLS